MTVSFESLDASLHIWTVNPSGQGSTLRWSVFQFFRPSPRWCRLVRACLATVCTGCTKGIAHVKDPMSTGGGLRVDGWREKIVQNNCRVISQMIGAVPDRGRTRTITHTRLHTRASTHACTHVRTHTHTHTRARAYAHTYACTQPPPPPPPPPTHTHKRRRRRARLSVFVYWP